MTFFTNEKPVNWGVINHETLVQQSQVLFSITGKGKGNGKTIPGQALRVPGSRRLRLPDLITICT